MAGRRATLLALVLAVVVACGCGCANASRCPEKPFPKCQQGSLDLLRYRGVWFTQLQSHSFTFGADCFCETANYTLRADGRIGVDNRCRKGSVTAPLTGSTGEAEQRNKSSPCELTVMFPPADFPGPYTIVKTDYTNYTIVVSCLGRLGHLLNLDDVWFLTRMPVVDAAMLKPLISQLLDYGFELDDLEAITQKGCPPVA